MVSIDLRGAVANDRSEPGHGHHPRNQLTGPRSSINVFVGGDGDVVVGEFD